MFKNHAHLNSYNSRIGLNHIYEQYNRPNLILSLKYDEEFLVEDYVFRILKLEFNKCFDLNFVLNLDYEEIIKINLFILKLDEDITKDFFYENLNKFF